MFKGVRGSSLAIWGVFVGTLVLVLASVEAGYRGQTKAEGREMEKGAPVGAMVGATLGLPAFLLAFTFGIAADAFHARKGRIVELQQERVMMRERSRIPCADWIVLYIVAALALTAMGYHGGVAGTGRSPVTLAVAIAFSAVVMVIADMDRPGQGFINVSQQPMVELREMLTTSKP